MKKHRNRLRNLLAAIAFFASPVLAQGGGGDGHQPHAYTSDERLVLRNVSTFHRNFNAHNWAANGPLVTDDVKADSNGAELVGRDAFVQRIARFAGPFPDVRIDDIDTVVDGNMAMIRFVITGTQKGDFATPHGVIKATNRQIHVDGTETFTFDRNGKVTRLITIERLDQLVDQLTR